MVSHARSSCRVSSLVSFALVLTLVLLVGIAMHVGKRKPVATAETRFVEHDVSGLQIIPASCPSDPHYQGDCTPVGGGSGGGGGGNGNSGYGGDNGCSLAASAVSVKPGTPITLTWVTSGFNDYNQFNAPYEWPTAASGSISPGVTNQASVPTGSVTVAPMVSTTYTLYGSYVNSLDGRQLGAYHCQAYVSVQDKCADGSEPPCAGSQCIQSCSCLDANTLVCTQFDCTQTTTQCAGGCSNRMCTSTGPSITLWRVAPTLVPVAGRTHITWQTTGVTSCVVTGTNGDKWQPSTNSSNRWGYSDSQNPIMGQTTYTIDCVYGIGGTQHITRSTTVNVIPTFQER